MNEVETGLNRYLKEIGQISLLTPEQEVELAGKIKRGDAKAREALKALAEGSGGPRVAELAKAALAE